MSKNKQIAKIFKETFAIIKARKPIAGAFANIIEDKEITIIAQENKISEKNVIKIERGYRLIKFDLVLQFNTVGFIAKISSKLAKERIPIFVISSFSTDFILVKQEYIRKATNALAELGFTIK